MNIPVFTSRLRLENSKKSRFIANSAIPLLTLLQRQPDIAKTRFLSIFTAPMLRYIKIVFFLSLWLCVYNASAQDMIQTTRGTKFRCKIIREDSVSFYYTLPHQSTPLVINKADVHRYMRNLSPLRDSPALSSSSSTVPAGRGLLLLNVSGGFANPLGDFASTNVSNPGSGLAKTGHFFQLSVILKLSKYIGVSLAYHYQFHDVDQDLLNKQFANPYNGLTFSSDNTNWKIRGFFGGLYFTVPIKTIEGLSVFANAMVGLPTYVSPELIINSSQNGGMYLFYRGSSSTTAIAYLGGACLAYKLYRSLSVTLSANYLRGTPTFDNVNLGGPGALGPLVVIKNKVQSLNAQLGLSFTIE